ncbi:MAG TPA: thioredoxin [Hydrogenophaga sp.]|uniref:thioredoxin n=1 Tax=Hydrogenophaga sp. TaxID=1904254 RepID=UPI002CEFB937|nr:thioredoxin [Hydrogenophaga sp.]HMN93279.1 thioredoxin [Hydrogenophaga sp.]HMP10842.1 thioredoxin [Hydrogenophaga sp.]
MINVTVANFEAEVIEASMHTPVLVDFWAPWCGPCKVIGPILEKVEAEYGGRFKLVKIDSDQEQQLAAAFGIRSIPTCVLLMGGQPVDGFMGALPEGPIKAFLDKHLPGDDELAAQAEAEEAQQMLAQGQGDPDSALDKLAQAVAQAPDNNDLRFELVKQYIGHGRFAEAAGALAPAMAQIPVQLRFEALAQWLNALEFVANDPRGQWPLEKFDELIAQNKRDFETRFAKSRVLIAMGEWPDALDELLEIIMRDKKWDDEAPRKTYVGLLELMTPPRPKTDPAAAGKSAGGIELAGKAAVQEDPQAQLVSQYRRKLSMALN